MKKIEQILRAHGVQVQAIGGRLLAYEVAYNVNTRVDVSKWIDVTDWTMSQLRSWLGY